MKLSALQKASEGRPRERRKSCVQRKLDIMVKSALDLSSPCLFTATDLLA